MHSDAELNLWPLHYSLSALAEMLNGAFGHKSRPRSSERQKPGRRRPRYKRVGNGQLMCQNLSSFGFFFSTLDPHSWSPEGVANLLCEIIVLGFRKSFPLDRLHASVAIVYEKNAFLLFRINQRPPTPVQMTDDKTKSPKSFYGINRTLSAMFFRARDKWKIVFCQSPQVGEGRAAQYFSIKPIKAQMMQNPNMQFSENVIMNDPSLRAMLCQDTQKCSGSPNANKFASTEKWNSNLNH